MTALMQIAGQLKAIEKIEDPIARGAKFAELSAAIALASSIRAPFRQTEISKAIQKAKSGIGGIKGVAVSNASVQESSKPERSFRQPTKRMTTARVAKKFETGIDRFADIVSGGGGRDLIQYSPTLKAAKGIASFVRKVSTLSSKEARDKLAAVRKGDRDRAIQRRQQRELGPAQSNQQSELVDVKKQVDESITQLGIVEKLEHIEEMVEKLQSANKKSVLSRFRGRRVSRGQAPGGSKPKGLGVLKAPKALGSAVNVAGSVFRMGARAAAAAASGVTASGAALATAAGVVVGAAAYKGKALFDGSLATGSKKPIGSEKVNVGPGDLGLADKTEQYLAKAEAVRLKAYKDSANLPTIGVGHLITKEEMARGYIQGATSKVPVDMGDVYATTISKEQAKDIFKKDVEDHKKRAIKDVGLEVWNALDEAGKAALTSYVYNVGNAKGLMKRGLGEAVKAGNKKKAAEIIASGVTTAGGKHIKGLVNRRNEEAELMANGFQTEEPKVAAGPSKPSSKAAAAASKAESGMSLAKSGFPSSDWAAAQPTQFVVKAPPTPKQETPMKSTPKPARAPKPSIFEIQKAESYRAL